MKDENKTKDALLKELAELRQQIAELKTSEVQQTKYLEEISKLKKRIEFILGATKTGLDIIDSEYNIRYIDPEWEKVYGSPAGKKCYEYFMNNDEICPTCGIERALKTKNTIITEELLPKENNRPIQVVTIPFQDSNGEWLVAEVNIDITERKKAEEKILKYQTSLEEIVQEKTAILNETIEKLQKEIKERKHTEEILLESEEQLRSLAEESPNMIFINCMRKVVYANRKCEDIMGYSKEELYSEDFNFMEMIDPEYRDVAMVNYNRHLKGEEVSPYEYALITKTGNRIDTLIATKLISFAGKSAILGIITDTTDFKKANEEIRRSKTYLESILNNSPDLFITFKRDGTINYINPQLKGITGYNLEDVQGKHFMDFVPEHGKKDMFKKWDELRRGFPGTFESDVLRADGSIIHCQITNSVVEGFDEFVAQIKDISEIKRIEVSLRESEEQFRAIAHAAGDAIIYMDGNGNIAYWNPAAERIFGYTSQEALGRELHVLIAPEKYHEAYKKGFSVFKATGSGPAVGKPNEFIAYKKDGAEIPIEVSFSVMHIKGQYHAVGVIRDISERKTTETALIRSEEKYRDLYDNAPDMYHTLDKNGVIINCNETEAKMLGYQKEEIIGRHLTDFFTKKSKELFQKDFPRLNGDKIQLSLEREFVKKDGSVFHANLNVTSEFDEKGNFLGTKTIARDITRRKLAEEALKENEIKYRSLFENSRDAIYITSRDGSFLDMNQSALDLFGFTGEELLDTNILRLYVNPEDRTRFQQEVEQKGFVKDYELNFRKKDGTEITCLLTSTLRKNIDGSIAGYQGIFRDITEKKRMEEELLKVEKLESLGILAGGIAHDFNNILTTIMGNISLALMYLKPEEQNFQLLIDAEKASLRARDLTQQLLTFSRGGAPIRKSTSIKELIRESAGFALRGSNVRCEINIPEDIWPVKIDEGQISQVIHNLVINADQAMPEGGVIDISVVNTSIADNNQLQLPEGKYVKTTIKDNGVGIPEGYLNKIFDPYFTTKHKGSGLGLAISFSIIKKHEGYIVVESGLKSGTSFHIYLPASEEQTLTSMKEVQDTVKGKGRILVMDDDESIREVLGCMLQKIGYGAGFAKDGNETIELYRKTAKSGKQYDAVIIDLTIPGGMGGKETIQKLRQIDPDVRAIVSSGYSNDPVMAEFEKYGFKDVIAKPYKISQLSKVLHKVLTRQS